MNRLSKAILIILVCLAVTAVVAVVGVNLYIQSPGTQAQLQHELSKALRVPLQITSTTVTPWSGLRIAGVTAPGEGLTKIEANSFSEHYRLLPLFRRRLEIDRMILESPKMVWAQNADGKWVLPFSKKQADQADKGEKKDKPREPKEKSGFEVVVQGIDIRNGYIELIDFQGERVAVGVDVNLDATMTGKDELDGKLSIGKLTWREAITLARLKSPIRYAKNELTLSQLEAAIAGGAATGKLGVNTEAKGSPFTVALNFTNIDVARLATEAGWQPGQASGTLSGAFDLHGTTNKLQKVEGTGQLALANGQFRQLEFFQTIGQVLQIAELSNLRLKSAQSEFHLADEKTFVDNLVLETPDLQLSAKGAARFDGKLALNAQLALSDRLVKQLPTFVRNNFTETDPTGRRAIGFDITGRTDKPRTNLLDKVVGQQVGAQFDDLVSSIFGGGKKKKDKEKKKDESKVEASAKPSERPPQEP